MVTETFYDSQKEQITFYDMLDELETIGSHIDIENYLVYILQRVTNAEEFFRLTFNDTVYGLAEKSFYNAYEDFFGTEIERGNFEHVSDFLYSMNKDVNSVGQKIPDLLDFAEMIAKQSGDMQLINIAKFFTQLPSQKAKWFCRALLHDLRCGVQVKTINKVFKRLGLKPIEKFSLQLCGKDIDLYDPQSKNYNKLTYPCSMECKEDGIRVQAEIISLNNISCQVFLTSRRGKDRTDLHPEIVKDLKHYFAGENIILDGEVVASSFQSLTRKDDTSKRRYVVFDILNDEKLPYINRWMNLVNLMCDKGLAELNDNKFITIIDSHIKLVEHYSANNINDIQEYYEDLNRRGEEGIIIKLDNRPYVRGSRKNMFKCKKVFDADLEIIGFNYGEGKRAGKVGSLKLKDKSGTIFVDVGAGLSDADVEELSKHVYDKNDEPLVLPPPSFVGKICEIQYNELTETGSIRFPRFIRIRSDKDEADDLS